MKYVALKSIIMAVTVALLPCLLTSCDDEVGNPQITGVWSNSASQENHMIECAYPSDIIRIEGRNFDGVKKLFVNGTEIPEQFSGLYNTPTAITFKVPSDVNLTTLHDPVGYIRVITATGEDVRRSFLIKSSSLRPKVSKFSTTILVAGQKLVITGSNLDGATHVWLPCAFNNKVEALIDEESENTAKSLTVIIPEGDFAQGWCEIEFAKYDEEKDFSYTERIYSSVTNFTK